MATNLKTIGVNDAYRRARLDILYACDGPWWDYYGGVPEFCGVKVTQDEKAARKFSLKYVRLSYEEPLCDEPGVISSGGNSGYQAVNIAYQLGAKRILLLGYDMGGKHWMKRPDQFEKHSPYNQWIYNFNMLAPVIASKGVEVINCSNVSALKCFKKAELSDVI